MFKIASKKHVLVKALDAVVFLVVELFQCQPFIFCLQAKKRAAQHLVYIPRFEDHTGWRYNTIEQADKHI